jgi:hypothetical protein
MRPLSEREQWLIERIGKRVYRPDIGCCDICYKVYQEGLIIMDATHADYLADMEWMYTNDGRPCKYFDTRSEALEFEKNNPPKSNS